ncbi:alpha/beta hydrolase [Nocardia sp. AG03]|uniref:alpha/beta fold hydrolase n=1 Tax=Nocardia sp. AG03 TaxID=3025312 RepID=UPI0024181E01|nr:alpha/beta hydrolase [Nocardia sp. AG03]
MREHNEFRPRDIVRPDAVLRGEEVGDGPTILLLHAGGERRGVWRPVVDRLVADGLRCVAFDQRGHGDSDGTLDALAPCAADVAALVDAEPGCVIVGASLGGLAAVAALAEPRTRAKVAGLVLVDVVPGLDPDRVRDFLGAGGLLDRYREFVEDTLTQAPRLRQITAGLDLPILLVRGDQGSAVTDDDAADLLALAPHATVAHVPGAGHLVARDQPASLARVLADTTSTWPILALLRDLGAALIDHPGGDLLDHLRRVRDLVTALGGSPRARLAALAHATYGTDSYPHPLLPLDQRPRLRTAVGASAESLVYHYGACDRAATYPHLGESALPITDRFTGEITPYSGTDLTDFAVLTIANELDVLQHAALAPEAARSLRTLIDRCAAYLPDSAARTLDSLLP